MKRFHTADCNRLSYTPTSCDCGFVEAFLKGECEPEDPKLGNGLKMRYDAFKNPVSLNREKLVKLNSDIEMIEIVIHS